MEGATSSGNPVFLIQNLEANPAHSSLMEAMDSV